MNMSVVIELENTWLEVLKTKLSIMGLLCWFFLLLACMACLVAVVCNYLKNYELCMCMFSFGNYKVFTVSLPASHVSLIMIVVSYRCKFSMECERLRLSPEGQ